jgi:hypothetical protein
VDEPELTADELLYMRSREVPAALSEIRIPQSVNRSLRSRPRDVIRHHPDWLVLACRVDQVPDEIVREQGIRYLFRPVADPIEDNPAHAEIRAYKPGSPEQAKDPPKTVRMVFRQRLAEAMQLVPDLDAPPTKPGC